MSLSSAMNVGVTGLNINSEAITVVGNNIANVNTTGFKEGRTLFSDMLSQNIANGQLGLGAQVQAVQNNFTQGGVESTSNGNDLMIQGDSFFVVQNAQGTQYFTRAGAFDYDNSNVLTNPDGFQVMGYGITQATGQSNGVLGTIDKTAFATLPSKTTTAASFVLNLDSTAKTPGSSVTSSVKFNGDFGQGGTTTTITLAGGAGGAIGNIRTAAGAILPLTLVGPLVAGAVAQNVQITVNGGAPQTIGTYNSTAGGVITFTPNAMPMAVALGGALGTQNITFPDGLTGTNVATATTATLNANAVANPAPTTLNFYDEFGNIQSATVTWSGNEPTYSYSIAIPNAVAGTPGGAGSPIIGTLNFPTPSTTSVTANITLNNGAQPMPVTFDLSSMKDTAVAAAPSATVNGAPITTGNVVLSGGTAGGAATFIDAAGVTHAVTITFPTAATWQADIAGATPAVATITGSFSSAANGKSTWTQSSSTVTIGGVTQPVIFDLSNVTTGATATSVRTDGWNKTNPAVTANFSNGTQVYDSQGNAHSATVYYSKTGANTWDYHVSVPDAISINGMAGNNVLNGSLTFDAAGVLVSQTPSNNNGFTVQFPGNVALQTVTLDLNPNISTQQASQSAVSSQNQNGYGAGTLISTKIDDKGFVTATYSNNQTQRIAQLATAKFAAVGGLEKSGNSLFNATAKSGTALMGTVDSQGGKIFTNSLEQSNVDMATQLVNMIKLQRAYSGNSKTITTADAMMQETLTLVR